MKVITTYRSNLGSSAADFASHIENNVLDPNLKRYVGDIEDKFTGMSAFNTASDAGKIAAVRITNTDTEVALEVEWNDMNDWVIYMKENFDGEKGIAAQYRWVRHNYNAHIKYSYDTENEFETELYNHWSDWVITKTAPGQDTCPLLCKATLDDDHPSFEVPESGWVAS
jgi:hypothetical protein